MTYEQALSKVKTMLRLAEGRKASTPEEAALYAAKAQEIMDRFNIEVGLDELQNNFHQPEEEIQDFWQEPILRSCENDKYWTLQLTMAVSDANGCKVYYAPDKGGAKCYVIGRPSGAQIVRYMVGWLREEIRRLGRENTRGYSDKFRRDFKMGVVDAIRIKLHEQRKQTVQKAREELGGVSSMALVRVNNAIAKIDQRRAQAEEWSKANKELKKSRGQQTEDDASARAFGQRVGLENITLNRAKGALGSSTKSIKE